MTAGPAGYEIFLVPFQIAKCTTIPVHHRVQIDGMNLKGSQTEKNILAVFAGESQARMRHSFFA